MSNATATDPSWKLLIEELHQNVVEVQFVKRDGTKRRMRCTLKESLLPKKAERPEGETQTRKSPAGVQIVWDLDAGGWRSFRLESIEWYLLPPFPKEETNA